MCCQRCLCLCARLLTHTLNPSLSQRMVPYTFPVVSPLKLAVPANGRGDRMQFPRPPASFFRVRHSFLPHHTFYSHSMPPSLALLYPLNADNHGSTSLSRAAFPMPGGRPRLPCGAATGKEGGREDGQDDDGKAVTGNLISLALASCVLVPDHILFPPPALLVQSVLKAGDVVSIPAPFFSSPPAMQQGGRTKGALFSLVINPKRQGEEGY